MNCFNPKYECMSREEMRKVQSERLIKTVHRVYENVPFYRKKMDDMGILPGDIKSVDDIVKLPFTTKQDLRDHYPFGLFAAPMEDVVRIHASSEQPKADGSRIHENDIEIWSETMARTFACAGGTIRTLFKSLTVTVCLREALELITARKNWELPLCLFPPEIRKSKLC